MQENEKQIIFAYNPLYAFQKPGVNNKFVDVYLYVVYATGTLNYSFN